MSTELFEAKDLADQIHEAARVPEKKNPELYNMTIAHITNLIVEMDKRGMTMNEQRTRMGRKKDELIWALKDLLARGIAQGDADEPRKEKPMRRVHMRDIQVVRPQ